MTVVILGCTSTAGRKFDTGAAGQIKERVSTKADVQRILGEPFSTSRSSDGTEKFRWFYAETSSSAGYGLLGQMGVGTGKQQITNLFVTFQNNIVTECALSLSAKEGPGMYGAFGIGGGSESTVKCSELGK